MDFYANFDFPLLLGWTHKFSTYAHWWIKQAMTRALTEKSRTVRIPVHTSENLFKWRRAMREIEAEKRRPATDAEAAKATGFSIEQIRELRQLARQPISVDVRIGRDADSTIGDIIPDEQAPDPDEEIVTRDTKARICRLVRALPAMERRVLQMRFGIAYDREHTLQEVSRQFRLSRERIRQIESSAMKRLRRFGEVEGLRDLWASAA